MFRLAFMSQHCVAPMLSYCEWVELDEADKKVRQPHLVHHEEGDIVQAAGILASTKSTGSGRIPSPSSPARAATPPAKCTTECQ